MYCVLMDTNTKCYYMTPGHVDFYAYSDISKYDRKKKNARIIETDMDDAKEFMTMLYNAGFFTGFLDNEPVKLSKGSLYFYNRNPNEVLYAQYLLTKNLRYLEMIKKSQLLTLCKIDGNSVYFPTITLDDGEKAVLSYTDKARIPQELFEKYDGWRCVKMTFAARCLVNGEYVAE